MGLLAWLRFPEAPAIDDLDDPAVVGLHSGIIRRKPCLHRLYVDFYRTIEQWLPQGLTKRVVKLGSGGGFIKEVTPEIITSDVVPVTGLDMCFSALEMPFGDASVDAFCMMDVLHHRPDVRRFLAEADRCLRPGGRIVMIEPANTAWGRFVHGPATEEA